MAEEAEPVPGQEIPLADMIETLRSELETAQSQGANRAVSFAVETIEVELKVLVSKKVKGQGGIKFWVINAAAGAERAAQSAHTFRLTLSPRQAGSGKRFEISSTTDAPVDRSK